MDNYEVPLGVSTYDLSKNIPDNFSKLLPTIEELESEIEKKSNNTPKN